MKLVDLNLLIYAVNRDLPHHKTARHWWEACLSDDEPIALSWSVILGFLRITTNGRIMPNPLSPDQAIELIDGWLLQPVVRIVTPTQRHWDILRQILAPLGTAGNLTSDAHLAVLAIEHGAILCSTDIDFARLQMVQWVNPLQPDDD
jgi:toxin-antitoxin system PIN domain toxin